MTKKIKLELLNLLKNIVKIDTCFPPGNSKKFAEFIVSYLKNSGLDVKTFGNDNEKVNVVASAHKDSNRSIVFNSHIDTVRPILSEWKSNPFNLKIEKNYSYGLGAVNCKGSEAVHL